MSHSTALPQTLSALTNHHRQQFLEKQPLLSLYEAFSMIPDPRSKHGLRYDLPFLLVCLVAALLCNCDSTLAVGQWCHDQRRPLIRLFGPRRFLCPSDSLFRKLLPRLDVEQIEWTLADWIRKTLHAQADEHMAGIRQDHSWGKNGGAPCSSPAFFSHPQKPGNPSASGSL